jgi:hypothetical protein
MRRARGGIGAIRAEIGGDGDMLLAGQIDQIGRGDAQRLRDAVEPAD